MRLSLLWLCFAATCQAAQLLVYTRTAGYRHESIPTAVAAIEQFGRNASTGLYNVVNSEDPAVFNTTASLLEYDAIAFLSNSDEILDTPTQRANLEAYLLAGKGLIGIHSGNAALFDVPFFGTALGAFFDYHPTLQEATFEVLDSDHPSTSNLPPVLSFEEEVYQYRSDPRATNVTLLLTVDPASYSDPQNGTRPYYQGGQPHPIAWYRDTPLDLGNRTNTNGQNGTDGTVVQPGSFIATGRTWYTSLGHLTMTWQDSTFLSHVQGGISWVLELDSSSSTSSSTTSMGTSVAATSSPSTSPTAASTSSQSSAAGLLATELSMALLAVCTVLSLSI
ncbi:uncharacterized protein L969DRAFT_43198 [Mixia osmundae IAM 14324]|uniref:ThuA-like domain-containing protein n=1 Tax=Mixia osmundae (strain CBS 9802 / IAM 14324 / JCM 22182 / KY 12970) TaxID=764103 RepID=G7E3S4_MIXOS|nr:uncharacterized protein L969DRAFT_43198 [Mixia osmundae IAM 14324]KEI41930.1 hypothetical protein L969DRAFT_43198 [Mixia osmundae IAM 14324]GAA97484.1 hypothetical protein E5Q_04162 [Mixia osmundae IAM 14324]